VLLRSLLVSRSVREFIDHMLTIFLGAGVIGDITTAKERGGLIGVFGGSTFPPLS
jgi:hypothetical protein